MPLDGFRILDWATHTFAGVPATVTGALGLVSLMLGVFLTVMGIKLVPKSLSLLASGLSFIVLAYFIVGAAINSASSTLAGGESVSRAAPSMVPVAAATAIIGLGLFAFRMALRLWSSEETSGKPGGILLALVGIAVVFVGVQIGRGSQGAAARQGEGSPSDSYTAPGGSDDSPVRRRGVGGARR